MGGCLILNVIGSAVVPEGCSYNHYVGSLAASTLVPTPSSLAILSATQLPSYGQCLGGRGHSGLDHPGPGPLGAAGPKIDKTLKKSKKTIGLTLRWQLGQKQ